MRFTGILLFLTFFLLPLHSHPQSDFPRLSRDCSCLHAARQDLAVLQVTSISVPPVYVNFIDSVPQFDYVSIDAFSFSIRAPPLS
jgi:hypothetical protein